MIHSGHRDSARHQALEIFDGRDQAITKLHRRRPTELVPGDRNVGLPLPTNVQPKSWVVDHTVAPPTGQFKTGTVEPLPLITVKDSTSDQFVEFSALSTLTAQ